MEKNTVFAGLALVVALAACGVAAIVSYRPVEVYLDGGAAALPPTTGGGAYSVSEFEQGGGTLATTTTGTAFPLTQETLANYSVFQMTPLVGTATSSFPASSTLTSIIKDPGDFRTWWFVNGSTTSGINLGLASSTGVTLYAPTSQSAGLTIAPNGMAQVTCVRKANRDLSCFTDKGIDAD